MPIHPRPATPPQAAPAPPRPAPDAPRPVPSMGEILTELFSLRIPAGPAAR
ncbi:hypothetical protein ACIQF6_22665 [Kitasatospora sp. NPDC092948]|uniref:hypothetical protein n=1 Tax=Kitasatospora sp. NPDC092948 TaxID=3364088 RepID=UPI003801A890